MDDDDLPAAHNYLHNYGEGYPNGWLSTERDAPVSIKKGTGLPLTWEFY